MKYKVEISFYPMTLEIEARDKDEANDKVLEAYDEQEKKPLIYNKNVEEIEEINEE